MKKFTTNIDISELILAGDTFTQSDFDALPIEDRIKHKYGSPASNANNFENNTTYPIQGEAFVLLANRKKSADSGKSPAPIFNLYWKVATSLLRHEKNHGLNEVGRKEKNPDGTVIHGQKFQGFTFLDAPIGDDRDMTELDFLADETPDFDYSQTSRFKVCCDETLDDLIDLLHDRDKELLEILGMTQDVTDRQIRNIHAKILEHFEAGDLIGVETREICEADLLAVRKSRDVVIARMREIFGKPTKNKGGNKREQEEVCETDQSQQNLFCEEGEVA